MSLLDALPEEKRNRLEFLINRGGNPGALNDLTRALSVVEADPELSAKATGERWNLMVYWDKSPIGKIPLMEIYPNESYGHSDWQSCFSNADYFVNLGAPERLGYAFYDNVADIRKLTGSELSSQKDKAARKINRLVADLKKGTGKAGRSTWKIHSPVTNLHFEEGIVKNEKAKTVAGDLSAPVYLYLGESGGGKDRRIKLEGATLFDKLLNLRKAHTYVSIGPADDSREWDKLDPEDQEYYGELQTKAKKLKTYKAMGDFLSQLCSDNECMLFAIRQGDDAVWVNPHILKELLDTPWHGMDSVWLDQAADVKGYWDKVIAAHDAGKDYSKIKPENRNEDHGSELLTVIDAVELADDITKAGRPFYIDTDHEVENGLDVWAVDSKTGEDHPRSWRVMDDLSVLVFNTDKNGDSDLVDEKSFGNIHELGTWLAKEFADLAGKNESVEYAHDEDAYQAAIDAAVESVREITSETFPGQKIEVTGDYSIDNDLAKFVLNACFHFDHSPSPDEISACEICMEKAADHADPLLWDDGDVSVEAYDAAGNVIPSEKDGTADHYGVNITWLGSKVAPAKDYRPE